MNPFKQTLQEDRASLDLCIRIASLLIVPAQRPRTKEYQQSDTDLKRDAAIVAGLKTYIHECGTRRAGNLDCIDSGKCLARIHDIGKIDYLAELNRIRDYASSGVWPARKYVPGPEPYEPVTLAEIDATIARLEKNTASGLTG